MYTLQGKIRPTHHTLSMLSSRMTLNHTYLTHSGYSNLSHSRQQIWTDSLPSRRRAPDPIHSMMADWSTGLYPASLPQQPIKQWGGESSFCWQPATRLTGPISSACNWYVQYLLAGANPSILNRQRRGLQPWRCQLSTSHSPTFLIDGPLLST
jgi:hypothetical protein